jgi:autotransporter-associated beta strand protein
LEIGSLSCGGWVKSGGSSHNFSIQNVAWETPSTLTVSGSTTPANSFDGTITDGGFGGTIKLVKAGAGTLALGYLNNYTGGTVVKGGTLTFTSAARMGGIDGAGSLEVSNPNTGAATNVILNLNSACTVTELSGTIATASRGTNQATINLLGGPTTVLTVNQNDNTSYAGSIAGTGGLMMERTGSLTIGGSITYAGDTTVNAGMLTVGTLNTPLGDVTVDNNSTLYAGSLCCDTLTIGTQSSTMDIETQGGVVAVPEPGTLLLLTLAIASLALIGMRLRRI